MKACKKFVHVAVLIPVSYTHLDVYKRQVQALLYTCLVILRRDAATLASSAVLILPDGASLWWQKEIQTGKGR